MRKTAAVCVAKLFDINPELVEDRGFLDMLRVGHHHGSRNMLLQLAPTSGIDQTAKLQNTRFTTATQAFPLMLHLCLAKACECVSLLWLPGRCCCCAGHAV